MSRVSSTAPLPGQAGLVLVAGGARSGKSRVALDLALARGKRRVFVATAEALDGEMEERIRRHRAERGQDFDTFEAPRALAQVARRLTDYDVVLVDCLTLYLSNQLLMDGELDHASATLVREVEQGCLQEVQGAIAALQQLNATVIVVSNEVGMGVVPSSRLGRLFRDIAGSVNQWVASQAGEVWWCALGIPVLLKPALATAGLGAHFGRSAPSTEGSRDE